MFRRIYSSRSHVKFLGHIFVMNWTLYSSHNIRQMSATLLESSNDLGTLKKFDNFQDPEAFNVDSGKNTKKAPESSPALDFRF